MDDFIIPTKSDNTFNAHTENNETEKKQPDVCSINQTGVQSTAELKDISESDMISVLAQATPVPEKSENKSGMTTFKKELASIQNNSNNSVSTIVVDKAGNDADSKKENDMVLVLEKKIEALKNNCDIILEFMQNNKEWNSDLTKEKNKCENNIQDILKKIEFSDMNSSSGWEICQSLQDKLRRNRKISDELTVINYFENCSIKESDITPIKNLFVNYPHLRANAL